jgi:hypothetical protein
MENKFIVVAKLPHAGLGNMLLVWARAVVFAHLNSFPMVAPSWQSFHIGPWLRRERCKRYYGDFFSTCDYLPKWRATVEGIGKKKHLYANPAVQLLDASSSVCSESGQHQFVFDKMPPWNDYFQDIKQYQPTVKQKLYADIRGSLLKEIEALAPPVIAIHIRRGDYQAPQSENDFAVNRCVQTPLGWYVSILNAIRKYAGDDLPATIFSDGYAEELSEILELPNVSMSPETSALSDMLTMSRSKLLIGSAHSSFSAWASYLGQCPTIWSSERYQLYESIFTPEVREKVYEGGFDPLDGADMPSLLKENLFESRLIQEKLPR